MKKALTILLIAAAAVILAVVVIGLFLSTTIDVSRSVVIDATPAQVHAHVNDLEQWPAWEPWSSGDPTIVTTLGDQTVGVGASQSWTGEKSGAGRLEIVESDPATGITCDLYFGEYDDHKSQATFTYAPAGSGTEVTWRMTGDMDIPVVGGYLAMITTSMSEDMFELGLAKLKTAVEASPNVDAATPNPEPAPDSTTDTDTAPVEPPEAP